MPSRCQGQNIQKKMSRNPNKLQYTPNRPSVQRPNVQTFVKAYNDGRKT